jgi:two-component system chemotaxis response regulator CheB
MASGRRIRILIVDDSAVMRSLLRSVVTADPSLEVAGTAADGATALNCIDSLRPDLVLLDVEMPVMDGLATLRNMRRRGQRVPVVMCSSLTQRGAKVTLEALACGASDYVGKPSGQAGREEAARALAQDLLPKIHALTVQAQNAPMILPMVAPVRVQAISSEPAVVVIGISTGGPAALDVVLPQLPRDFPLPVLIVQHMPELFTSLFAERLNGRCKMPVREAKEGEAVKAGEIAIARGNWHLEVLAASRAGAPATMHLTQGLPENHCRPAADVLFRTAAEVYGAGVLAVVMTGMGADGMAGCQLIRSRGGSVLAQDQASSTVWGMPGAVVNAGLAQRVLPLQSIAPEILRMVCRTNAVCRETLKSAV